MKTPKIFIGMLILLSVSMYADDDPAYGFTEAGCDGYWIYVTNWIDLYDYHDDYDFQSYYLAADPDDCHPFPEEVVSTGTVPTTPTGGSTGGGSSGGGGGRSGGTSNGPPVGGTTAEQSATQDEMNENLRDCWVDELQDNATITSWIGEKTNATWISKPKAHWQMSQGKYDAMGVVNADDDGNLTAILFPSEIAATAAAREAKVEHMQIMVQMHEHTHLLQWTHYMNTHGGAIPPPYLHFDMEVEGHRRTDALYRAFTGSSPPYLTDAASRSLPRGFRANRKEYIDLEKKQAKGTLTPDDEKRMKTLEKWFKDPENLPKILEGKNAAYDPNVDLECEEDEDASE